MIEKILNKPISSQNRIMEGMSTWPPPPPRQRPFTEIALDCGVDPSDVENILDMYPDMYPPISDDIYEDVIHKMNLTSYSPPVIKCMMDKTNINKKLVDKYKCLIVLADHIKKKYKPLAFVNSKEATWKSKEATWKSKYSKQEKKNKILIIITIILFTIALIFIVLYIMKKCDNELEN